LRFAHAIRRSTPLLAGLVLFASASLQAAQKAPSEAQIAFNQAMLPFDHARWAEAVDAFTQFSAKYGQTPFAAEAAFRRGYSLNRAGRFSEARHVLQTFLEQWPTSTYARQANIELAFAEHQTGDVQDAEQILKPVLPTLTDTDKRAESLSLEVLAPQVVPPPLTLAPHPVEAPSASLDQVRQLIEEVKAGKVEAKAQLEQAIDQRSSFIDIARLYAEADTGSPAWGLIAAKMARIQFHIGDLDRAKTAADQAIAAGVYPSAMQPILDRVALRANVKPRSVGLLLPLSGRFKAYGDQLQQGFALALQPADKLELVVKDTQGDPAITVTAVEELAREGVIAIIGPFVTGEAIPAAIRAQELGIPMISLSRAEGVTEMGSYIFRNSLTNSQQGKALARYVTEVMNAKRAAILAPDISTGTEVAQPFWESLEAAGGEVRGYETYAHDQTTFSGPLRRLIVHRFDFETHKDEVAKIKATIKNAYRQKKAIEKLSRNAPPIIDFDVLLIPDYYKSVLQIAPALAVEDVVTNGCDPQELERIKKTTKRDDVKTVTMLGTAGWDSPDLIARGGRYVQCAVIVDGFHVGSEREPTKKFVAAYREKYNQDPGLFQAQAFDTLGIVRDIVTTKSPATREAFRESLIALQRFPGATGETTFAPNREADKPLFFLTVDKAGFTELPIRLSPEAVVVPKAAHP
jgi:ABC-type branched-subunit amino acid transport system substrate-binding protein/predicted negative regulator of RcsB-dependent stress response